MFGIFQLIAYENKMKLLECKYDAHKYPHFAQAQWFTDNKNGFCDECMNKYIDATHKYYVPNCIKGIIKSYLISREEVESKF